MNLSEKDIKALIRQESITDEWPWNTRDERIIHKNIKKIVSEICRTSRLHDITEYNHYGSGYASFVDCWLYRDDREFKYDTGNSYWGLVVLFSTLSHYFVLGEGKKTWNKSAVSSYLPSFQFTDKIDHPATKGLVRGVCSILEARGLVRALAADLSLYLPPEIDIPTILTDPPYRHFDALFHWED